MTSAPKSSCKNVVMNGCSGLEAFPHRGGDTAGLVNTATQTSMAKILRLSQATSASHRCKHAAGDAQRFAAGHDSSAVPGADCAGRGEFPVWTIIKVLSTPLPICRCGPLFSILNHALNFTAAGQTQRDGGDCARLTVQEYLFRILAPQLAGWRCPSRLSRGMVKVWDRWCRGRGTIWDETLRSAHTVFLAGH